MTLLKPTDPLRVQAVLHFAVRDYLALVYTLLFRACAPQLTTVQRGGGCDTTVPDAVA